MEPIQRASGAVFYDGCRRAMYGEDPIIAEETEGKSTMKSLTENFIENLMIGLILFALALTGVFFLREKVPEEVTTPAERVEKVKVSL